MMRVLLFRYSIHLAEYQFPRTGIFSYPFTYGAHYLELDFFTKLLILHTVLGMATGSHPDDGNDDITFNVRVAKQMTVPDEITLTGPIDRPYGDEPQMETPRMVVPDDITYMDTLGGGKNDSLGSGVLRKTDRER